MPEYKWQEVKIKSLTITQCGAVAENGVLPAIGSQTTGQAVVQAKSNYLRFGVSGQLIKASQGDKGSFAPAVTFEMDQGVKDLSSDVNRQMSYDGSGTLATVSANAVASTVITVTGRESSEDGDKFLQVGTAIDIYSGSTRVAASATITAIVSGSTATLTLDTAVTCSANDVVVRAGSYGNEIQGILTQQDGLTTTIFGIDRSAYPQFTGNLVNANGGQLTLDIMQQALNLARYRGDGEVDYISTSFDGERYYSKLLVSDKRYIDTSGGKVMGDGTFLSKGKSYLAFAGVGVLPDKDMPLRFAFLTTSTFKKAVLADLEWQELSAGNLLPQPSQDAFEARLALYANVYCEQPNANAVLKNFISP